MEAMADCHGLHFILIATPNIGNLAIENAYAISTLNLKKAH